MTKWLERRQGDSPNRNYTDSPGATRTMTGTVEPAFCNAWERQDKQALFLLLWMAYGIGYRSGVRDTVGEQRALIEEADCFADDNFNASFAHLIEQEKTER